MSSPERRNIFYQKLLESLTLSEVHKEDLLKRGFDSPQIESGGYRSLDSKRNLIIDSLVKENGEPEEIPGFYLSTEGKWKLSGRNGLLIPVRGPNQEIISLKIRDDKPKEPTDKYKLLSSTKKGKGAKAKVSCHYPTNFDPKEEILRITEGELKADILSHYFKENTISIPGVHAWKFGYEAVQKLNPKEVILAFDSDKEKEFHNEYFKSEETPMIVGKSLSNLFLSIQRLGIPVSIEHWHEEDGKGLDDVISAGNEDSVSRLSEEEAEEFVKKALGDQGGQSLDWVYVVGFKSFLNLERNIFLDKEQFGDKFNPNEEMTSRAYSESMIANPAFTMVDSVEFFPDREKIIHHNGDFRTVNTWTPMTLPSEKGDVEPLIDHLHYILPEEDSVKHLLNWFAFNRQFPAEKINWAVLIQGEEGTGKSFLGGIMEDLLGEENISKPRNEEVHEKYGDWQMNCSLVIIEELMAEGRIGLANKLKPIITENMTRIRSMHKTAFDYPNRFNLMAFTNHQNATIISKGDRRYFVNFSNAVPKSEEYYNKLWGWRKENGNAIRHFFDTIDLSKFNPKGKAPMTEAKRELTINSLQNYEQWISEGISSGEFPFKNDLVCPTDLSQHIPRWVKGNVTPRSIAFALKKFDCDRLCKITSSTGERKQIWSIRRKEMWSSATSEALKEKYFESLPQNTPGANPLEFQSEM